MRRKCPGMLSNGVISLHDNTHTAHKAQELPQKFKCKVWSPHPYSTDLGPYLGCKHLSGTRLSSDCAMKTVAENWLKE
ncbi:hypothetical protein AVEN_154116-1 [Araneus ventricosus]|uniref:Histone-lysine N-methyltransferase SETMAR n=1 Tax=Araneus ventricosus TaxID=182803 RepID=A0A4Y2V5M5_ARAVE|nr:hypothetical protein AVEN_124773-1 [Araneus ventricosus]GBO19853.1 hypothetical protein AVEN_154116-1 [Araneus ventricosus]